MFSGNKKTMAGTAKWGDAKNIVETVYGGALLRGTYHRYDLEDVNTYEDYSIPRWPLVQLKNNFTPIMRGPMMPVKAEEFEFHSKEHFETFEKSMERSEIYLGGNLKIFGSFATSIKGGRLKEDEMFKRKVSEKMFYCRVRNEFVPIASVQLNSDDIILTDKAYKALIEFCDQHVVKNTGTNEDMYEKCEYFFENFGTHVNVGLVHLGGILTWKSEFFAETNASETEIQSLVKSSLAANANAGFATSEAGASAEFSATRLKHVGKFSQKDLASTFVSRRIYGGSAAAKSAYDWYQSLRDDSLTWVIVDRGDRKTNDQIGVWDIIRQSKQPIKIYHKDNNMVEVDKDKLKEKLFAIFNQWLYRRKIKVIINGLEKEPNASDYLKTLEKIETENKTRKDRFGAFDNNNSWYFLLKEEKEISDFLLKPLNLEQTQTAFLIKINTQITESLLDEKSIGGNGRSDEKFVVDLRKKVERKLAR